MTLAFQNPVDGVVLAGAVVHSNSPGIAAAEFVRVVLVGLVLMATGIGGIATAAHGRRS